MLSSYWDDFPSRSPMGWRMPLQVQRKGGFFTDSLFQGTRSHFDRAMREVMQNWDVRGTNDDFKSYRMFRDRQLNGTDRASSLSEEDTLYKVVMDVQGFIDNDLKVTFLNENELIVEGMIEKKSEGSFSRQTFKRRFVLPSKVIVNDATSALSSDNILTITIPKQLQQITGTEQASISSNIFSNTSLQSQVMGSGLKELTTESSNTQKISSSLAKHDDFFDSSLKSLMEFPITRRSDFLGDSFFDNVRSMFQSRVHEIMNRRTNKEAIEDVNMFRSLRDNEDQNVAVTVAGDSKEHKIVLDVHGYSEGDLKVKAVSQHELLVEGRVEKKSDNSYCNNSFRRNFCLPNNVNIEAATSALSSDGVLTISVPKKEEKPLPIEYAIPVRTEESLSQTSKASEVLKETTSVRNSQDVNVIPTIIPLGYTGKQTSELTSELRSTSEQKTTSGTECIIPVSLEETNISSAKSSNEKMIETNKSQAYQSHSDNTTIEAKSKSNETVGTELKCTLPEKKSTTIVDSSSSWKDTQIKSPFSSTIIPINIRGSFCDNSIFDSTRHRIESAVHNAMKRSTSHEDHQKEVQLVQQQNIMTSDNSSTSMIQDDANSYKISLDVYGFSEKDLTVRIASRNELSVEGVKEIKKDDSISKHSFERTFHLPDTVNIEAVSSDLSSEGMLTVTLPKKKMASGDIVIPVTRETQLGSVDTQSSSQQRIFSETSQQNTRIGAQREYKVPVTLEGDSSLQKDLLETQHRLQTVLSGNSSVVDDTRSSVSSDFQASERSLNTNVSDQSSLFSQKCQNQSQIREVAIRPCFDLPIIKKGHFHQDSFFNDSRDMFDSALKKAMSRFNKFSSFSDNLDFYKTLRQEKVGGESQTAVLSADANFHKVVVDVQGYPQESLKIKVVEGNGILVEGKVEEKAGNAYSTKSFRRSFFLPQSYNLKEAVTALSSDGILSIKIPKGTDQSSLTF